MLLFCASTFFTPEDASIRNVTRYGILFERPLLNSSVKPFLPGAFLSGFCTTFSGFKSSACSFSILRASA